MRKALFGLLALAMVVTPAFAGHDPASSLWQWTSVRQNSGWVVTFPTGSSDYFSCTYFVVPGLGNNDRNTFAQGLPVSHFSVSVADFASGRNYASMGMYRPNLGVDAAGNTPDLLAPVSEVFSPTLVPPPNLYDEVAFELAEGSVPVGDATCVAAVQLPPGDSGLLGVGADSTAAGQNTSGWTSNGFATPTNLASFVDWGLNPGLDNSATASCKPADRKPHGRLRVTKSVLEGDHLSVNVAAGDVVTFGFFGTKTGDKFRMYFAAAPCTPAVALGPVLPTVADGDGDGSYLRFSATWPAGFGGSTFKFAAVWGNPACLAPGVGFTDCVEVVVDPDPTFGVEDDGTVESGWVVSIPSGSSDYFNVNFRDDPPGVNGVVAMEVAVMDFITAVPAYPDAGVCLENDGMDPSGNTPDLSLVLAGGAFTFPSGTFATTSGLYVSEARNVSKAAMSKGVHAYLQFPPGDPGLLGVGGDTTVGTGYSGWTLDGYSTPANMVSYANWGMRLVTN